MTMMTPDEIAEMDALRDQVAQLQDRIASMQDEIFAPDLIDIEWGLTGMEARILAVLVRKKIATKRALCIAAWTREEDIPEIENNIESHISKLRKKLRKFGILIYSRRHDGYWLEPSAREDLRRRLIKEET